MRRCTFLGCVLAALTLYLAQPVAAQPAGELSIGYSFLSNDDLAVNEETLPFGFFFGTALKLNDSVSLAFDLNGHYKRGIEPSSSLDFVVPQDPLVDFQGLSFIRPEDGWCSVVIQLCEVHIQGVGVVIGPRFHAQVGRARPFFHIMGGATRYLRKIVFFAHTATHFTIQPGGGIDVDMTEHTAFRIQGDYRRVFFPEPDQASPTSSLVSKDGADYQDFTFSVGVVFRLGGG